MGGIPSILLDYVLAYAAVGVAGFCKKGVWGVAIATGARFLVHFVSGVTIYAITASETVYGITTCYETVRNWFYLCFDIGIRNSYNGV